MNGFSLSYQSEYLKSEIATVLLTSLPEAIPSQTKLLFILNCIFARFDKNKSSLAQVMAWCLIGSN